MQAVIAISPRWIQPHSWRQDWTIEHKTPNQRIINKLQVELGRELPFKTVIRVRDKSAWNLHKDYRDFAFQKLID